jgi:hypothetical protein
MLIKQCERHIPDVEHVVERWVKGTVGGSLSPAEEKVFMFFGTAWFGIHGSESLTKR